MNWLQQQKDKIFNNDVLKNSNIVSHAMNLSPEHLQTAIYNDQLHVHSFSSNNWILGELLINLKPLKR